MTKALVVEDNPLDMEILVYILTACGFTVETAVSGEEAVMKAENGVYDLIVMDIELPCMDGITATRFIKNKPGYESTPVIAVTAYERDDDMERFHTGRFNEYIPKPINVDEFMKIFKKYRK